MEKENKVTEIINLLEYKDFSVVDELLKEGIQEVKLIEEESEIKKDPAPSSAHRKSE